MKRFPLLLAALCACRVPPPDYGAEGPLADAALLHSRVQARGALFRSLRGEAKSRVYNPKGSVKLQDLLAIERPDKLRVDALSFFGQPLASLASDGQRFAYLDIENNRYYRGVPSAANVGRFLPLKIAPADIVALFLGDLPPISDRAVPELALVPEGYTLSLRDPESGETIIATISPQSAQPLAVRALSASGDPLWLARFDDFQERGPPREIQIEDPSGAGVELTYQEIELNVDLPPETFTLAPPPGAQVE